MSNQFFAQQAGAQTRGNLSSLVQALDDLVTDEYTLPELTLTDETVAQIQKYFTISPDSVPGTTDDA